MVLVLYAHTIVWGQALRPEEEPVPEPLQALGLTPDQWTHDFCVVYNAHVVPQGRRWLRFRGAARCACASMFVGFGLTIAVLYGLDASPTLVSSVLTIGWFPLYGVTVVGTMVCNCVRRSWLDQSFQREVVQACNATWQRDHIPLRLQWRKQPLGPRWRHQHVYRLEFYKHDTPNEENNDDVETVATEVSS